MIEGRSKGLPLGTYRPTKGMTKMPRAILKIEPTQREIEPTQREIEKAEFTTYSLARYLGVQRGTLLQWLRRGHVSEPKRDADGKRLFTRDAAEEIKARLLDRDPK